MTKLIKVKAFLRSGAVVEFVTDDFGFVRGERSRLRKMSWNTHDIYGLVNLKYLDLDQVDAITTEIVPEGADKHHEQPTD